MFVSNFVESHLDIKTLTDLGSGCCRLNLYLKNSTHLEQINYVDKSKYDIQEEADQYCRPLLSDMLFGRQSAKNLTVCCYHSNIKVPDDKFKADCITLIEVIEHMELHEHEPLLKTILEYYQPKYCIITTPNRDFNPRIFASDPDVVDDNTKHARQFRHADHRFEWSRTEFIRWCQTVCQMYPNYNYSIHAIGMLDDCLQLGPGTQAAIFSLMCNQVTGKQRDKNYQCFDMLIDKLSFNQPEDNSYSDPRITELVWQFVYPRAKIIQEPQPLQFFDWSSIEQQPNQQQQQLH